MLASGGRPVNCQPVPRPKSGVIGAVVCGYVGVLVGIGGVSGRNFPSLLSVIVAAIGALAVVAIYRSVAARA